jgi:superfamily II DNA/RNA helicase
LKFEKLQLHADLLEGISAMGFEEATPIQEMAIPPILEKKDLIGSAQTGTGKTAAFLLPVMNHILNNPNRGHINALIIVPTRELAVQIDQQIQGFSYFTDISSIAIYGGGDGTDFSKEKKALTTGTDIVVVTPGRMISHLNLGYVNFTNLDHLILDEADRMLDMGFHQDIMRIIKNANKQRQTLLFSATMPKRILELSKEILTDPVHVNIALSKPAEGVLQGAYVVFDNQKVDLITTLVDKKELNSAIVFASTKKAVSNLYRALKKKGLNVGEISSDLEQDKRQEVMLDFKNRKITILVATDVVSRGIDIDGIELVINYDVPGDAEDYVHRIGRTARAASTGVGLTLITPNDQHKFFRIEQLIETTVRKLDLPPNLGPGPEYNPKSGGGGGNNKKFYGKGRKGKGGYKGSNRK